MNIYLQQIQQTCAQNKYTKWYISIVNKAKTRIISDNLHRARIESKSRLGYVEGHHIWPKSVCKNKQQMNDFNNYVFLTAREHFICHKLLTKMFTCDLRHKMNFAFSYWLHSAVKSGIINCNSHNIELAKTLNGESASKSNKGKIRAKNLITHELCVVSNEEFESNDNLVGQTMGSFRTNSSKQLQSLASKGKPKSKIACDNMRKAKIGYVNAKNIDGICFKVTKDDIRLSNNELGSPAAHGYILTSPTGIMYKTMRIGKTFAELGLGKTAQGIHVELGHSKLFDFSANYQKKNKSLHGWTITRVL